MGKEKTLKKSKTLTAISGLTNAEVVLLLLMRKNAKKIKASKRRNKWIDSLSDEDLNEAYRRFMKNIDKKTPVAEITDPKELEKILKDGVKKAWKTKKNQKPTADQLVHLTKMIENKVVTRENLRCFMQDPDQFWLSNQIGAILRDHAPVAITFTDLIHGTTAVPIDDDDDPFDDHNDPFFRDDE